MTSWSFGKTPAVASVMTNRSKSPLVVKGEDHLFLQMYQRTKRGETDESLVDPVNMNNISSKDKGMVLERKTCYRQ